MQTQLSETKIELYHMHISNNANIYSSSSHGLSIRISRPLRLHMNHLRDVVASNIFLVLLCCIMLDFVWKKNIQNGCLKLGRMKKCRWVTTRNETTGWNQQGKMIRAGRGTRCRHKVMSLKINEHPPGPAGLITIFSTQIHWTQVFKVIPDILSAIWQTSSAVDGRWQLE